MFEIYLSNNYRKGQFYDENPSHPVYQWTHCKQHFSIEELGKILLTDYVPCAKICSSQPTQICHNTAFVVNMDALEDPNDIRADENGVWNRKGSPIAFVSVHGTKVIRRSKLGSHSHRYKLTRTYYHHSTLPDFHRIITIAHDIIILYIYL